MLGFLVNLTGIWELWNSDWSWRIMADFIILSVAFAHASLLFQIKPKTYAIYYIRMVTIVSIAIVAGMLICATLNQFENSHLYFRILGIFAILNVLGTVLIPLMSKIISKNDT